ncbi:MAG TPA: hypothetical protein VFQ85_13495 [Mycobacteriales bacterium]|jgi:hypothetical protein|nr:hypothetical protein [Mycobacteriales bacterium]
MAFAPGSNRAPRYLTILVAVILAVLGALGMFGPLPDKAGAWLAVTATVVMLLGVFVPGL